MDKLKSMQVFVSVVENGRLRKTADQFDMSATMVGKHIQFLEAALQTCLLNRTTRKQSLTESGQAYYEECKRILEEVQLAENRIQTLQNTPQGTIKVNCPVTYGSEVLAPIVADFLQQHTSLDVEMTLENALIDPFQSDADLFIRIGELHDSTLVARQLGVYPLVYCAAPDYLAKHGEPKTLDELKKHTCLGFVYSQGQTTQSAKLDTDAFRKRNTRLAANNGHALKTAALHNAGIILQPSILVCNEIARGDLISLLDEFTPAPKPVQLIFRSRNPSIKIRTFIDFVVSALAP
ncbi:LysR family transcriptional regulator [Marinomonas pollencensis]|uniref:LysR family transcriptional regulator n=1 Tax=Marinomonas pollencensis TaxID=491954 RepID=A0A3E0DKF0_9GAMM|nr:LysR family transcriptional regulator [Marinomonas pollencensis]REG81960.1 LysR family transcriptional regulator [Marinomonas pollencensis]